MYNGEVTESQRAALILKATDGDGNALQALIVEYHAALRTAVERQISSALASRIEADDVLQDAYVAAFRGIGGLQFASPQAFYVWLERVALNQLVNLQRAATRKKRDVRRQVSVLVDGGSKYDGFARSLVVPDSTPSRVVGREEAVAAMLSGLARLTDDQREVIRLRFLDERPVAEVAKKVGRSEDAVHALCRRGLLALREHLGSLTRFLSHL